jgi:hypothetical protein
MIRMTGTKTETRKNEPNLGGSGDSEDHGVGAKWSFEKTKPDVVDPSIQR